MAQKIQELDNDVVVYQVTDEQQLKDNIYCERSYCSPDSRYFLFQRKTADDDQLKWKYLAEYEVCEFGSWESHVVGRGCASPEVLNGENIYYTFPTENGGRGLARVRFDGNGRHVFEIDGDVKPITGMTISPDENFLAYGVAVNFDPQMFGVEVVDLDSGNKEIIFQDPCINNPHPQFESVEGNEILIQHNRGCEFSPEGKCIKNIGEEGCTLFTVNASDGSKTPLLVGPPHTTSCTGHQQWIGKTGEVLLSIRWTEEEAELGNLLAARPGKPARRVSSGSRFTHVHASVCGRFFCCDNTKTSEIFVGSITTGKYSLVCSFGPVPEDAYSLYGQSSHAHPYLSPDLKWVVFNSCRTGRPEIHVAEVPPELIEELDSE